MKKLIKRNKSLTYFLYFLALFFGIIGIVYAINNAKQIKDYGDEASTDDGVKVSKIISPTEIENFFDITLTVETSSNIQKLTSEPDVAVVIVMDISNTMRTNYVDTTKTKTRYNAAIEAGEQFITSFAEFSENTDAIRKIGYVSFNRNAHETFPLQECKDSTTANSLISTMKTSTQSILNTYNTTSGYSNDRWTNIEGGLKRGWDMLNSSAAANKYLILLSDGYPTTYLNRTTDDLYDGYIPKATNSKNVNSAEGIFANTPLQVPCWGTDYSDLGAIRTREMATQIKNANIDIMVVGTGIDTTTPIKKYLEDDVTFSTIDATSTTYEIGTGDIITDPDKNEFKIWLKNKISSNQQYYDSNDKTSIVEIYNQIFNNIVTQLKASTQGTWVAKDPMSMTDDVKNIEFIGLYDDLGILQNSLNKKNDNQSDTAIFSKNEINWDLKNSSYESTTKNGVTYYKYQITYRVRLGNELSTFDQNTIYNTNGTTTLSYIIREINVDTNEELLSAKKNIDFPIPSVIGYLGEFSFTKKSSYGDRNLEGIKFELVHDAKTCFCHDGYIANMTEKTVPITTMEATSDENGLVTFAKIPSGHQYILKEVSTPNDHDTAKDYFIEVNYGVVTGTPKDNELINYIKTGDLKITKQVKGNDTNSGVFKFLVEIDFDGEDLIGEYDYKIVKGDKVIESGTKKFKSTEIELEKNQTYIISGLPVGATYSITETTTEGYIVKYNVNNTNLKSGVTAKCDFTNSCRIEEENNEVLFINTTGYILPATGSSGMLILLIIGSLLIGLPVINIGYAFYQMRKEDKLTS